jgi:uncharacterized protein YbjT (DUF2867 family)
MAKAGAAVVLGRGENPINFVSARDVASLVELSTRSPALRGREADIGGPDDLTLDDFVRTLMASGDLHQSIRHVPRALLRTATLLLKALRPNVARVLEAGLMMDVVDMTFSGSDIRARFPEIPTTRLVDLVAPRLRELSVA